MRGLPLLAQPARELVVAIVRVEHAANDELRRDGAVPTVLLEAEDDVVAADSAETVELRALPERDRAAGVATVLAAHAELEVLAVPDRREITQLARWRQ